MEYGWKAFGEFSGYFEGGEVGLPDFGVNVMQVLSGVPKF